MSIAREIVSHAIKSGSSDIHLEEDSPIAMRVNSDIKISSQHLIKSDMDRIISELISVEHQEQYKNTGDLYVDLKLVFVFQNSYFLNRI